MAEASSTSGRSNGVLPGSLLLATKLYIPPARANLVPRPRLLEWLDQALTSRLTLISAPAGFGKTTLLSAWISDLGMRIADSGPPTTTKPEIRIPHSAFRVPRVAWLSLDAADNDPVRFLRYLVAALQTVAPQIGEAIRELLRSPQPPPMESVLTLLINEVCSLPDHLILILDDYHAIEAVAVHNAMIFLLDNLPPPLHLVIATRADPPLPLARWRSRGQLVEIRTDDLRSTPDESATFLNQVMGLSLSVENIAALESRTEGWIVGLQMAAISMQGRTDIEAFIRAFSGSHRYVLDYLVEEVLDRQSQETQTFLLQTSILDRLCGPLCDEVIGTSNQGLGSRGQGTSLITDHRSLITDSQSMLEYLERSNLFLVPLDDERHWYRYHHLFSDVLRARFRQSQPELATTMHLRAADWHEHHGLVAEAVSHALAAGDLEHAASMVEQSAIALLSRGEMTTLLSWSRALPEGIVLRRPRLCIVLAWVLAFSGRLDETGSLLQAAEQRLRQGESTGEERNLLGQVAAIRSAAANMRGRISHAIELGCLALELLPSDSLGARGVTLSTLGHAYSLQGDLPKANQAFTEFARLGEKFDTIWTVVQAKCELAGLRKTQGKLRQAADLYREALQAAETSGQSGTVVLVAVGLGDLLREQNDLEAARRHLTDGIEHALWTTYMHWWESPHVLASGYVALACVLQAQGDWDGAGDAIQKAEALRSKYDVYPEICNCIEACRVRLLLAKGDLQSAVGWMDESGLDADDALQYTHAQRHITLARVLITQDRLDEALSLLTRLAEAAEAGGYNGRLIEILVLQALAQQKRNKTAQALAALEKGLSLAEPEGYVRVFLDEGLPMAALLKTGLERDAWHTPRLAAYADRLLATFDLHSPIANLQSPTSNLQLIEPLSERELEVLHLMADGLSNSEIAARLFLAVGTVKSHVHNIYGKLGTQGRTHAIARARELNLL